MSGGCCSDCGAWMRRLMDGLCPMCYLRAWEGRTDGRTDD